MVSKSLVNLTHTDFFSTTSLELLGIVLLLVLIHSLLLLQARIHISFCLPLWVSMAAKRVASCSDFSENDVKSKRVFNDSGVLDSPATSDPFEPDEAEETVGTRNHLRVEMTSSDLCEPISETESRRDTFVLSPISSELYELLDWSETEVTPGFSDENAIRANSTSSSSCSNNRQRHIREDEDLGCFPLPEADEELAQPYHGKSPNWSWC